MSGVTGSSRIKSRDDFKEIVNGAKELIKDFYGFKSIEPSGSYNSDKSKDTFGDVDLITIIDGSLYNNDKTKIKKDLSEYMLSKSSSIVTEFTSEKHKGKRYYNSGEIVSIAFKSNNPDIQSAQVDFIVALNEQEADFKKRFLDIPAAKQGLILGATKVCLLEEDSISELLSKLNIVNPTLEANQEIEFSLSSKSLQLRKITYNNLTEYKTLNREILYNSTNFDDVTTILYKLDLSLDFKDLLNQISRTFKKERSIIRIKGIFKSMVSITSGELNTEKGDIKAKALKEVDSLSLEKSSHGVFIGRFQPVTLAHKSIIDIISKENESGTIFLVKGKKSSNDKDKNPFSTELQKQMLEAIVPSNIDIKIISSAFFINDLNEDIKNFTVYAGSDRIKGYQGFSKYMDGGKTLVVKEIKRTVDDISATKVRNSIKDNDIDTFKSLTPKELHNMFNTLKKEI